MILLDSNILIYSEKPENLFLRELYLSSEVHASVISRIEVLGYNKITQNEKLFFQEIFEHIPVIPLTESVIARSIILRQEAKMSLGDSIIAATALEYGLMLYTANTDDFSHIEGLRIKNPMIS